MKKLPVKTQTVDMETGKVEKTETVQFDIMPAPEGTCPDCAVEHHPGQPHDATSLRYQYVFYANHGRWPTWVDAMAHCDKTMKEQWTEALEEMGVDVAGGQLRPARKPEKDL